MINDVIKHGEVQGPWRRQQESQGTMGQRPELLIQPQEDETQGSGQIEDDQAGVCDRYTYYTHYTVAILKILIHQRI